MVLDATLCKHLLSSRKVQQYLHDEKDLIIVSSTSPVSTALKVSVNIWCWTFAKFVQTLIENNVHSAPVYDEASNTYLGYAVIIKYTFTKLPLLAGSLICLILYLGSYATSHSVVRMTSLELIYSTR